MSTVRYPPVRRHRFTLDDFTLDDFAARSGVHPRLLHRFVALGLIDADLDDAGQPRFCPADLATVARIQRLRTGLALNYAAIGLVMDLLDQIDALRADGHRVSAPPWRPRPT